MSAHGDVARSAHVLLPRSARDGHGLGRRMAVPVHGINAQIRVDRREVRGHTRRRLAAADVENPVVRQRSR